MNDLINNTIQQITDIAGGFSGVETVIYRNGNLVRRSATGVETVISLDFTETDPTVPGHVKAITSTQVSNWDTAFGWGNHASAGYLTSATLQQVTTAGSVTTNSITVGGLTSTGTILAPQSTSVYALASATTPSLGLKFYASSLMIFMAGGQDTVKIGTGYFASNAPLTFGSQASAPYINYSGNNLLINAGTLTTTGYTSIQTGNLLVGTTTNAGYKLDVNGSARATSVYTADIYPITSSVNLWVNSLNAASRFYTSPVHQDGRINFNAVAGGGDQVLIRAWHTGQFGLGTGSSSAGAALTVRGDSLLVGTSGSLYFMAGTFGPVNVPYRLGITTDATTTYFSTGVGNNLTNIESHAFAFTAKSHTFYTGTTAGNQGNPNQYTPLHLSTLGNVVVGSTTDAGYKLDVAGTGRYTGTLTIQSTASDASPSNSILITTSSSGNGGRISWGDGNTSILRFSNSLYFREYTGNFVFENSSTGSIPFSVRPSGTTVAIGNFVTSGSITAASALARGVYFNNTLVAAANNDVLVGLDINPTFTNGAFTGVSNLALRVAYVAGRYISFTQRPGYADYGRIQFTNVTGADIISSGSISFGPGDTNLTVTLGNGLVSKITTPGSTKYDGFGNQTPSTLAGATNRPVLFTSTIPDGNIDGFIFENTSSGSRNLFKVIQNNTTLLTLNPNGNLLVGTTTDAGYKLDVNGNARVQNSLYLSTSGSLLYADTNNIRLIDKNNRIILQSYPEGVASSETYLQSSSGSRFLRIREDYMGLEWCNSNVSNVAENPIRVVRGFFGNVAGTNKSVLLVQSTSFSNLSNATTLRGIYIDINDTTTYTGFATVRAIEAPRGGAYFNTTSPHASAVLQADSTTQGFLPPRMTTAQRLAITGPATSLIVFDTTADKLFIKTTAGWEMIQSVLETLT